MSRSWLVGCTAAAVLGLTLSACGGESEGSADSGEGTVPSEVSSQVEDFSEVPTEIAVDQPLSQAVPAKNVGFVICGEPGCAIFEEYWTELVDLLGWELTTVNATVEDPGSAVTELVEAGVDYI